MISSERVPDLIAVRICDGATPTANWQWWIEVVDDEGGVLVDYVGDSYARAREYALGWGLPVIDSVQRTGPSFVLIDGGRA